MTTRVAISPYHTRLTYSLINYCEGPPIHQRRLIKPFPSIFAHFLYVKVGLVCIFARTRGFGSLLSNNILFTHTNVFICWFCVLIIHHDVVNCILFARKRGVFSVGKKSNHACGPESCIMYLRCIEIVLCNMTHDVFNMHVYTQ